MSAPIITPEDRAQIQKWLNAFRTRYGFQPPEFTEISAALGPFRDMYRDDTNIIERLSGAPNPLKTHWFDQMLSAAVAADLASIEEAVQPALCPYNKAYLRVLQYELLTRARDMDSNHWPVSPAIPVWFRDRGWRVPPNWHAERPGAATGGPATGGPATGGAPVTPPGSPARPAGPAPRVGDLVAERLALEARAQESEDRLRAAEIQIKKLKSINAELEGRIKELETHNQEVEMECSRMMSKHAELKATLREFLLDME